MMTNPSLDAAYAYCLQLARSHYENFPVASLLLPKSLRRPVSVIYAFARKADDFADEGNLDQFERLQQLDKFSEALTQIHKRCYRGNDPIFIALADVIYRYPLPIELFHDLLTAFKQDVIKSRYADFSQVIDYCRFSANPVGRLLLHLAISPSQQQLEQSDAVCSSLQLINFFQDIVQDYQEQDRIYIPQNELAAAGLKETDLIEPDTQKIAPVLRSLYQRTARLMQQGYSLGTTLPGKMGWEVRAMTLGGITTLHLLAEQSNKNLFSRPRLNRLQIPLILSDSSLPRFYISRCEKLLRRIFLAG